MPTHTVKGKIRRFCSLMCRNTANSRAGNPERTRNLQERVARGEWVNPAHLRPRTSQEQAPRARLGRKREVAAGIWRNPALGAEARAKLSGASRLAPASTALRRPRLYPVTRAQAHATGTGLLLAMVLWVAAYLLVNIG
jgi:hypothetical protein